MRWIKDVPSMAGCVPLFRLAGHHSAARHQQLSKKGKQLPPDLALSAPCAGPPGMCRRHVILLQACQGVSRTLHLLFMASNCMGPTELCMPQRHTLVPTRQQPAVNNLLATCCRKSGPTCLLWRHSRCIHIPELVRIQQAAAVPGEGDCTTSLGGPPAHKIQVMPCCHEHPF